MRIPLEDRIGKNLDSGDLEEFDQACQAVFSSQAGQLVLRMLCLLVCPMKCPLMSDPQQTAAEIGAQEVVKLLWRRSEGKNMTPTAAQKTVYL